MATLAAPSPSRIAYAARRRGTARPPRLDLEPAEIDRKSSKKGEKKAPKNEVVTWPAKGGVEVTLEKLSISDSNVTEWTAFSSEMDHTDQFEGRHDEEAERRADVSDVRCPEESNSSWMREPIDAKNLNRVHIIPAPDDEQSQDENLDTSNRSHRRIPSASSKSKETPSNARPPVIRGSSSRSVATTASSQNGRPPITAGNGSNSDSDSSNNNSSGGENNSTVNSTSSTGNWARRGRSSSRRRMEPKERSVSRGSKVPDAPSSESQTQSRRGRSRSIGSRTSLAGNISSASSGHLMQGIAATSPSTIGKNRGRSNSRVRTNNTESATASSRSRSVNPSPNSSGDMKRNSRSKSRTRHPSPSVRSVGSPSTARTTGILSPRSIGVSGGTPRSRRGQVPPFHRRSTSDLSSDSFVPPRSPVSHVRTRSQSPMRREFERKPSAIRKEGGLVEKLFGDAVPNEARQSYLPSPQAGAMSSAASMASGISVMAPDVIHSRTLLTATVYNNTATKLWITTINTNQKPGGTNRSNASKYLKAFSFKTESEARESAIANAPPRMIPFSESPQCFICQGKFAVFRRASHCRNCGTCVCSSCSVSWPTKMIPETYNLKSESVVKVCKSCNYLSGTFRKALMDGEYDEAVALYNTGNVNLRCPCKVSKGEVMYPIHAAVEGGNLDLIRWLVDEHYCPIKLIRTSNKVGRKRGNDIPILTSKGRSVLNIAMTYPKVSLLRYLVREKGVSVHEIKDLKTALGALEAVLHAAPAPVNNDGFMQEGEFGIDEAYSGDYSEEEESMQSREEYEANEKKGDSSADGTVVDAVSIFRIHRT
eukprot:scaffold24714_cov49-Attheya_sp.AAC.1